VNVGSALGSVRRQGVRDRNALPIRQRYPALGKRISKNFSDPGHSIAVRAVSVSPMSRTLPEIRRTQAKCRHQPILSTSRVPLENCVCRTTRLSPAHASGRPAAFASIEFVQRTPWAFQALAVENLVFAASMANMVSQDNRLPRPSSSCRDRLMRINSAVASSQFCGGVSVVYTRSNFPSSITRCELRNRITRAGLKRRTRSAARSVLPRSPSEMKTAATCLSFRRAMISASSEGDCFTSYPARCNTSTR